MNDVRQEYTASINKYLLLGLLAHLPLFVMASYFFKTSMSQAIGIGLAIMIGPVLAYFWRAHSNITACVMACAGIMCSGLFIHLGKGMIEMHFHIFAFLACLTVYGLRAPIIAATVTVVVHHIGFFFLLPESIFNYKASFYIVLLHAAFVVLEDIGLLFIATKFGNFIDAQSGSMVVIKKVSHENIGNSSKLSHSAQSLAASSHEQAASIAQMSASLKELTRNMDNSTADLDASIKVVSEIHKKSTVGANTMGRLEGGVKNISSGVDGLKDIVSLIAQIGDKVTVINDIVFKTQLLSFNASIEAARAGQHGRGFAIVAEEVGQLALSSGQAAKEIESLLSGSHDQVNGIVDQIQSKVKDAEGVMGEASTQFGEIVAHVDEINQMVDSLGSNNKDNRDSLGEFNTALANIETAASGTTQSANEVEKLANLTKDQADELKNIINITSKKINIVKSDRESA